MNPGYSDILLFPPSPNRKISGRGLGWNRLLIAILSVARLASRLIGFSEGRGLGADASVRWKVKARFLLNRNRKILPGALYQGHFTGRLKKALGSRGPR